MLLLVSILYDWLNVASHFRLMSLAVKKIKAKVYYPGPDSGASWGLKTPIQKGSQKNGVVV